MEKQPEKHAILKKAKLNSIEEEKNMMNLAEKEGNTTNKKTKNDQFAQRIERG